MQDASICTYGTHQMFAGYARRNTLETIARTLIHDAKARPREWQDAFADWDQVVFENGRWMIGFEGEVYQEFNDGGPAIEALVDSWLEQIRFLLDENEMVPIEVDRVIAEIARWKSGLIIG